MAIASGANVKAVQRMLGHKSATMTLDVYGHLFGDDLDSVAERLNASAANRVQNVYGTAEVIDLAERSTAGNPL